MFTVGILLLLPIFCDEIPAWLVAVAMLVDGLLIYAGKETI